MPCDFGALSSETFTKLCKTDAVANFGNQSMQTAMRIEAEVANGSLRVLK